MKTLSKYCTIVAFALMTSSAMARITDQEHLTKNITKEIPNILPAAEEGIEERFYKVPDVAQYKEADWNNVVGIARKLTLDQAYKIANDNPDITYFFYVRSRHLILEKPNGEYRSFRSGDVVFFSGEPWWGSAPGFADGYIKKAK